MTQHHKRTVIISHDKLEADLVIPSGAKAIVLFAHGTGSSRHSTRNQHVAELLNDAGIATVLVDLFTMKEKEIDDTTQHFRFNIELLAGRIITITEWLRKEPDTRALKIGYFSSSTGAAGALVAAAKMHDIVKAIVIRGGRSDLAESALHYVIAPTMFIVGSNDEAVRNMNKRAIGALIKAEAKDLLIIEGASHLFEEAGKMEVAAKVAADWFECYLLGNKKFINKHYKNTRSNYMTLFSGIKDRISLQMKFKDRVSAGETLASMLNRYRGEHARITVIGIPRGGVIVADVVAKKLAVDDFDVIISRKLRAPNNLEKAIGAIMRDGSVYLDTSVVKNLNVSEEYIEDEKSQQKKELERMSALYRPQSKDYKIKDRIVILVDDGIDTGATIIAAARWMRVHKPQELIVGVPVAPRQIRDFLKNEVDRVEVIRITSNFRAVEEYYQSFAPVMDSEVIGVLRRRKSV